MEPKPYRIFKRLQEAESNGVLISDMFQSVESDVTQRQVKMKICDDLLDKNAITVEGLRWILTEYYWSMTKEEYLVSARKAELLHIVDKFKSERVMFVIAILLAFVCGHYAAYPKDIETCIAMSGYDIISVDAQENNSQETPRPQNNSPEERRFTKR